MIRAAATILFSSTVPAVVAEDDRDHHLAATDGRSSENLFSFEPHLAAAMAFGGSTSEKNIGLIQGGHAPIDDGFDLQGIELGFTAGFGERLDFVTRYNVFWDRFDGWDGEWEDAYLSLDLPGNLTLRGGQFLAPFGYENQLHLHQREFVAPPISLIRLLGEDALFVQGGELAWQFPGRLDRATLHVGYGQGRSHTHGSVREERREAYFESLEDEDHEDEHHEEDEDHEEEHHHAHGFAGGGGIYDPDGAYLDDGFFFARLESSVAKGHGLNTAGLSFAGGKNGFGRTTWIIGADLFGSFEVAERPAWWRTEAFYRQVDAYDRTGQAGDFDESGIYGSAGVEFADHWTTAVRAEWASGDSLAGLERRWRLSANVGQLSHFGPVDVRTRLQYSYHHLGGYGNEHSVWLQFVLEFGSGGHAH